MKSELTVLLSAKALFAFGSRNEVRVADGLVNIELLLFGRRHSLGRRAGKGGAFALLYQAGNTDDKIQFSQFSHRNHTRGITRSSDLYLC